MSCYGLSARETSVVLANAGDDIDTAELMLCNKETLQQLGFVLPRVFMPGGRNRDQIGPGSSVGSASSIAAVSSSESSAADAVMQDLTWFEEQALESLWTTALQTLG